MSLATSAATKPALFLPGWGFGRGPVEAALAGTNWQVHDLPGTSGPVPASFAAARDALLAELPPSCHLGGWSLGGMLALACAAKAPERILSLTLVGSTPSFVNRDDWELGRPTLELPAFITRVSQAGAAILPRFAGSFCRGDVSPDVARQLLAQATPQPQAAMEAGLTWLGEADLRASLPLVRCPVTVIHGEQDPLMPVAAARWLAEHLPQATLHILPGKAHAPFAPDPAIFLEVLPQP